MNAPLWALLAPGGFRAETERELAHKKLRPWRQSGDFFLFRGPPVPVAWADARWLDVKELPFTSISDAARKLRPLARVWEHLPLAQRGRGNLIFDQLRALKKEEEIAFPTKLQLPEGAGAFTLLEEEGVAYWCRDFDRSHPLGKVQFREDRQQPPSRAYLKLWEALCLRGEWPGPGQKCLDLGACPGGWTWVLASLGAEVLSVDRSPLEPKIAAMPGVSFRRGDAFQLKPEEAVDWLCCDVISAPERLLEMVEAWVQAGKAARFVCTLKFQGEADPAIVEKFEQMGRVLHLHHNKHELTFLR
jgi:23S rRNA (cytidine2498-2'-O)-methyltransferase